MKPSLERRKRKAILNKVYPKCRMLALFEANAFLFFYCRLQEEGARWQVSG